MASWRVTNTHTEYWTCLYLSRSNRNLYVLLWPIDCRPHRRPHCVCPRFSVSAVSLGAHKPIADRNLCGRFDRRSQLCSRRSRRNHIKVGCLGRSGPKWQCNANATICSRLVCACIWTCYSASLLMMLWCWCVWGWCDVVDDAVSAKDFARQALTFDRIGLVPFCCVCSELCDVYACVTACACEWVGFAP